MFSVLVPLPAPLGFAQGGVFSPKNQGSAVFLLCAVGPSPLAVASGCFLGMFFGGAGVSCDGTSHRHRGPHPVPVLPVGPGTAGGSQPCSRAGWGWHRVAGEPAETLAPLPFLPLCRPSWPVPGRQLPPFPARTAPEPSPGAKFTPLGWKEQNGGCPGGFLCRWGNDVAFSAGELPRVAEQPRVLG